MLPGMKVKDSEPSEKQRASEGEEGEGKEEEEEEEGKPLPPTPRKRLMNFKIPLVRGSQRRDQQHSVVARRRLYRGGEQEPGKWKWVGDFCGNVTEKSMKKPRPKLYWEFFLLPSFFFLEETAPPTKSRSGRGYYSDISSSEDFSSSESEKEEEEEGEGSSEEDSSEPFIPEPSR